MSAEVPQAASAEEKKEIEDEVISPEKAEEAKVRRQNPGGSNFLSLACCHSWGRKESDTTDKMKNKQLPTATPDKTEDLPQWKPSLVVSKLAG
ncbi:hypothetical protein K5549_009930 [Capra hircus]|uniref:Uncharacterized protein n=1 Tax=Capra hircus TaxID=9925 RepID=A0A452F731_CAPHI|nr:hypothetical protein K5549_009930 [Capra hircus]